MFGASQLPEPLSEGADFYRELCNYLDRDTKGMVRKFFIQNHLYTADQYRIFPELIRSSTPQGNRNGDDLLAMAIMNQNKKILGDICSYFGTAQILFDDEIYGQTTALSYALEHGFYQAAETLVLWALDHATAASLEEFLKLPQYTEYMPILEQHEVSLRGKVTEAKEVLTLLQTARVRLEAMQLEIPESEENATPNRLEALAPVVPCVVFSQPDAAMSSTPRTTQIETSDYVLSLMGATIDTSNDLGASGSWLIDPMHF